MYQLYTIPPLETKKIGFKRYVMEKEMSMYYDVVVNSNLYKCEQLYRALLRVNCKCLHNAFLKQAVINRNTYCLYYAYRIYIDDNGIWFYHSYRDVDEVYNRISLTDFINIIQPERTVII